MPETVVFVPVICVTHFSTRNNEKAAGWCSRVEQVEEGRAQRAKWDQIDHFGAFLQHRCETLVDDHFLAGILVHVFETLFVIKLFSETSCPNFAATLGANGLELSAEWGTVTLSGGRSRDLA